MKSSGELRFSDECINSDCCHWRILQYKDAFFLHFFVFFCIFVQILYRFCTDRFGIMVSETRNTTEKARKIIDIEGEFSYEKEWDRRKLRVGCRAGTVG